METQMSEEMPGEVDDKNIKGGAAELFQSNGYENGYTIQLLDLSDDVLLIILRNLSPSDLKALGFTCMRFASLVLERSLWRKVDARGHQYGTARFQWLLKYALHQDTTSLMLTGYAGQNDGCWGHYIPKPGEEEPKDGTVVEPAVPRIHEMQFCARNRHRRQHALFHIQARQLPRVVSTPSWPDEPVDDELELLAKDFIPAEKDQKPGECNGPRFTFTKNMYFTLITKCPNLTSLVLEYCNINCRTILLSYLPPSLKTLSLKGAKCFNLLMDRSFLFKIQDALPGLETLDFSECDWLDPSSFLPLSKLRALTRLRLRDCPRLSEFVAYSSLASRYGFRVLQELDLRGCPVGDSEISSLSWLPELRVLRLAAQRATSVPGHRHHQLEHARSQLALQQWEIEEPDFFMNKFSSEPQTDEHDFKDRKESILFEDSESDDNCTESSSKKRQEKDKNTKKRNQEDGSGDADVNRDAPSCSKSRKTDETKGKWDKSKKDTDSESDDDNSVANRRKRDARRSPREPETDHLDFREYLDPRLFAGSESDDDNCTSSSSKKQERDKKTQKRKQEDGSGDADVNRDAPSCSKSRKTDETKDDKNKGKGKKSKKDNDSDDHNSKAKSKEDAEDDSKVVKRKSARIEARAKKEKEADRKEADVNVNDGASTSWERSRHVRGFICLRRNRSPDEDPVHRAVYLNFNASANEIDQGRSNFQSVFSDQITFLNPPSRLQTVALVSDSSVRQFGRADGENITYVNFGPNGPVRFEGVSPARPARSNLRTLSMVGYTNITDRSLVHLATAAPLLEFIDFRGTRVTEEGVQRFLLERPDCKVLYGKIEE